MTFLDQQLLPSPPLSLTDGFRQKGNFSALCHQETWDCPISRKLSSICRGSSSSVGCRHVRAGLYVGWPVDSGVRTWVGDPWTWVRDEAGYSPVDVPSFIITTPVIVISLVFLLAAQPARFLVCNKNHGWHFLCCNLESFLDLWTYSIPDKGPSFGRFADSRDHSNGSGIRIQLTLDR